MRYIYIYTNSYLSELCLIPEIYNCLIVILSQFHARLTVFNMILPNVADFSPGILVCTERSADTVALACLLRRTTEMNASNVTPAKVLEP